MNVLTLGESLGRLSSFDGQRLTNATQLNLTYGGAEGNVAVNLAQLDHTVAHATKVPENLLSTNLVAMLKGQGVNTDHIIFGGKRLGTYFLEGGAGLRPSRVIYDRAYSAIAMMEEIEWNLDDLFTDIDLFHITGITLALSKQWHKMGIELIKEAHKRDILISFDMNYRQSMWTVEEARQVFQMVLPHVDYLSATKMDAIAFMDIDEDNAKNYEDYIFEIAKKYPNLKIVYGTNRINNTPNTYTLKGYILDTAESELFLSKEYYLDQVIDRVGAGDSFSAGILDGLMNKTDSQDTVDFAMAAAVLKHTIHGDINRFTREDILEFINNECNIIR